jgi:hypothetical protein
VNQSNTPGTAPYDKYAAGRLNTGQVGRKWRLFLLTVSRPIRAESSIPTEYEKSRNYEPLTFPLHTLSRVATANKLVLEHTRCCFFYATPVWTVHVSRREFTEELIRKKNMSLLGPICLQNQRSDRPPDPPGLAGQGQCGSRWPSTHTCAKRPESSLFLVTTNDKLAVFQSFIGNQHSSACALLAQIETLPSL